MANTTNTIDHATLSHVIESGALRSAEVVGFPGGWGIVVKYGTSECTLSARRGSVRMFRRFETVVAYLKGLGVVRYQVNAEGYDPHSLTSARARPDAAARMRGAFDAASHDQWFRDQVNAAIAEANDPAAQWVSDEAAQARWRSRREALDEAVRSGDAH
ncbi:hypothetical protein OPU71_18650 [Niveibacterium sp. 24ML]|uniref:hypothetical protein n=1 Tax=Niveibacterium sp. 24ML TaxID=2985512 RepID=UPI00226DB54E|nr:hypothetical protein [Niveibacterium sp. 24ML]MCX9158147.1 hypothetical protein [Niveibacterium sp. 24ML]